MFDFLSQKFSSLFSFLQGAGRVTKETIDKVTGQVEEALLDADVPYDITQDLLEGVRKDAQPLLEQKSSNPGHKLMKLLHERLLVLLKGDVATTEPPTFTIPSVVMAVGLQGAGKTTTLAKVANRVLSEAKRRGKTRRILCASVDYYRPAAREQLRILAEQVGVDYFEPTATDAISAAREIDAHFRQGGYELLFFDTAGRLHVDAEMMSEIQHIKAFLKPKYTALVLDTMTGQESLTVAQQFADQVGFDGAIMAKMDSDARGGAALAFRKVVAKPIWFVGTGEKIADIEPFVPDRMVSRLIGMGDLATLLEKADEVIDKEEQERVSNRMMSGNFTLNDFAEQMAMVNKMGALQTLSRYLPGVPQVSPEQMAQGQKEMKRFRAIISSMTPKERTIPQILDKSRKRRVANGAGVQASDVTQLLEKFEQSKQFVKMMKQGGKFRRFFGK